MMALMINARKDEPSEERPEPVRKRKHRNDNVTPLKRREGLPE